MHVSKERKKDINLFITITLLKTTQPLNFFADLPSVYTRVKKERRKEEIPVQFL